MTEENRLKAFLENGEPPQTPPKPVAPPKIPEKQSDTGIDKEMKMMREELVKMRYILEDVRDGKISAPDEIKTIMAKSPEDPSVTDILSKIAMIREDILRLLYGMNDGRNISKPNIIASLEAYSIDLENLLLDYGVSISPHISEDFDVKCQQISSVVKTDDPSLQGKVAESIGDYYVRNGVVICKTNVKVYKYEKKPEKRQKKTDMNKEVNE